jgi:hypothetical protein
MLGEPADEHVLVLDELGDEDLVPGSHSSPSFGLVTLLNTRIPSGSPVKISFLPSQL